MDGLEPQALGYLASALVFATFYMRTMLPLRCVAIASNVVFLTYGYWLGLWPIAILHTLLLPLNILRLIQTRRMLADVHSARNDEVAIHALVSALRPQRHPQGTVLFRKGDPGDSAYYLARGEVAFPEIGARVGAGQLFGEIGILSPDRTRSASAICTTDTELYRIDEHALAVAFHQAPAFAFALMRLVSQRLLGNIARLEAALAAVRPESRAATPATPPTSPP